MARKLVLVIISILVMSLAACSSSPEPAANVRITNGEAMLDGRITSATALRLREASQKGELQRLVVNSDGGDPMAALQIGYLLHREQLPIDIRGLCTRECANYLFPAAVKRNVYPQAVVSWSGGAIEQSLILSWESYILPGIRNFVTHYSDQYLRRERRFYETIGVDPLLPSYGFHPRLGCAESEAFYYSWPDLVSMGIGPTEFIGQSFAEAFSHYPKTLCRVDLSNRQLLLEP